MESRKLAALLSSLISELILVLFLLFPSSIPLPLTSNSYSNSNFYHNVFPLISQFLCSQEIATSLSLTSVSRKRKRTPPSKLESELGGDDRDKEPRRVSGGDELGLTRNPDSVRNCFKMTSSTFEWLCSLLEPLLECRDPVGLPLNLSADLRLSIGLFRLATGSEFPKIAVQFGVSESVARFCAKQLCRVLCTNFRFWVEFPSPNELQSTSAVFQDLTGLPNCCGVIECTRFRIFRNDGSKEESIATQIVADSSSRILSIVAGFRGDKSDSEVLRSSTLFKDIEGGKLLNSPPLHVNGLAVNQYLVGNEEYPLLPWLMIPFATTVHGSSEESLNAAHNLMCLPALRTIVSLRNWGVLSQPIREDFKTAVSYIGACSILHNALLMRNDHSALCDELGGYSLHDQYFHCYKGTDSKDISPGKKASLIRSTLAMKAKEFNS